MGMMPRFTLRNLVYFIFSGRRLAQLPCIVQHSTAIYLSSIQLTRAVGVVIFVIVESLNLLIN
jgi:hypothetical protein